MATKLEIKDAKPDIELVKAATEDRILAGRWNVYQRLASVMEDMSPIPKTGVNKEQGYRSFEWAHIAANLQGKFAEFGVIPQCDIEEVATSDVVKSSGSKGYHVVYKCKFWFVNADDPDDITTPVTIYGESIDYSDKAHNKALTSAYKNFMLKTFLISDKEEQPDPDQNSPEQVEPSQVPAKPAPEKLVPGLITAAQTEIIKQLAQAKGMTPRQLNELCNQMFGAESWNGLTQDQATKLITQLKVESKPVAKPVEQPLTSRQAAQPKPAPTPAPAQANPERRKLIAKGIKDRAGLEVIDDKGFFVELDDKVAIKAQTYLTDLSEQDVMALFNGRSPTNAAMIKYKLTNRGKANAAGLMLLYDTLEQAGKLLDPEAAEDMPPTIDPPAVEDIDGDEIPF